MNRSHQIPNNVQGSYAVIFSYQLSDNLDGYEDMDQKTIDAVVNVPGYLGYEKFGDGNQNTFISYWKDLKSVDIWRKDFLHIEAKPRKVRAGKHIIISTGLCSDFLSLMFF